MLFRRLKRNLSTLVLLPLCLICLCVCVVLFELFLFKIVNQGNFEPKIPDHLLPTAKALLQQPISTPDYLVNIEPEPGITSQKSEICIEIRDYPFRYTGEKGSDSMLRVWNSTRFVINGSRLSRDDMRIEFWTGGLLVAAADDSNNVDKTDLIHYLCAVVQLPPGLHLFELQIRDHPLGQYDIGEIFSYQWAYEIR